MLQNTSTQSKVHKSAAQKARKIGLHRENKALRASLESQKSAASGQNKDAIQQKIDAISRKGGNK